MLNGILKFRKDAQRRLKRLISKTVFSFDESGLEERVMTEKGGAIEGQIRLKKRRYLQCPRYSIDLTPF